MQREHHPAMTTATEAPAMARKVAGLVRREDEFSRMGLRRGLVDSQTADDQGVRHIVGDQLQTDGFAAMHRDARGLESKPVSMHCNDAGRLLSHSWTNKDNQGEREQRQVDGPQHDSFPFTCDLDLLVGREAAPLQKSVAASLLG